MGKSIVVACDFDGTISVKDVNGSIYDDFGNEKTQEIENKYRESIIGLRESLYLQYKLIGIDERTFNKYVYEKMDIDPYFFEFYDYAKDNGIKVVIISGGFINYVKILFDKNNRKLDMPIYSNKLGIENGIMLPQYGEVPDCIKHYGPCGICKYKYIMDFKKENIVLYVGDGHTDRCAAESADMVFAKESLEKFCIESGINYIKYDTFKEVKDCISNKDFMDRLQESTAGERG